MQDEKQETRVVFGSLLQASLNSATNSDRRVRQIPADTLFAVEDFVARAVACITDLAVAETGDTESVLQDNDSQFNDAQNNNESEEYNDDHLQRKMESAKDSHSLLGSLGRNMGVVLVWASAGWLPRFLGRVCIVTILRWFRAVLFIKRYICRSFKSNSTL